MERLPSKNTYHTDKEIYDMIRPCARRVAKDDTKNLVKDIHKSMSKYPDDSTVSTQEIIKDFEKIDDFFIYTAINLKKLEMKGSYEKGNLTKILVDFVPRYTEAVEKEFLSNAEWAIKRAIEWYGEKVK